MSAPSQYLEPVSSDAPCGDVTSVGNMWQIDGLFSPSGGDMINWKPDWKEVTKVAERLLPNCKHVKLALVYTGMAIQQNGLPGFRDGLSLLKEWLERYWDNLYPQLDKELVDPYEQMLERINELRNLTSRGIGGIAVLTWLDGVTICRSNSAGRLSFRAVAIVRGLMKPADGEAVPMVGDTPMTVEQLDAAFSEFRQADPDTLTGQIQALKESQEILNQIDTLVSEKAGSGRGPNLGPLHQALDLLEKCLAPYADGSIEVTEIPAEPGKPSIAAQPQGGKGGPISSREDVLKAIQSICEYYRQREPSSPVPLLLQRAGRLIQMGFLEIVDDLAIENGEQARRLLIGSKKEAGENEKS